MTMLSETPATKGDIAELRDELRTHYATKADIAGLHGELQGMRWTLGVAIGAVAVGLGVLQLVLKYVA